MIDFHFQSLANTVWGQDALRALPCGEINRVFGILLPWGFFQATASRLGHGLQLVATSPLGTGAALAGNCTIKQKLKYRSKGGQVGCYDDEAGLNTNTPSVIGMGDALLRNLHVRGPNEQINRGVYASLEICSPDFPCEDVLTCIV